MCLIALARWQRYEDSLSLILATLGLLGALVGSRRLRRPRAYAALATGVLAVALGIAVWETSDKEELARAGEMWALAARNRDVRRVADAITAAQAQLVSAATQAARTGIATLPDVQHGEIGLAVFQNGEMTDRAGQARVLLAPDGESVRLVRGAFHTSLVANVTRGERTAVATVLLRAEAPADRFARALVPSVVTAEVVSSIRLDPASSAYPVDSADSMRREVVSALTDEPVLIVSADPRSLDEARLAGQQRARVRTSVPLAIAAVLVLVVAWRRPARLRERLLTVLGLLTMLFLAPLGALSNVSPLFSAANYYSPVAGPLTGNIAALTLASVLALLALFRVLRSSRLTESRWLNVALVLGIAALGPFALRDLARGIAFPPSGPSLGLWVAWQLAIALAAAGILIAGASAGQVVIGRRRGLPASIGPVLAVVAATAAPVLWNGPGAWPDWYPMLWIVAIACLAFVKRGRALVTAVAFVAGCGAITLTWGATTRTRMQLAERDVQRLSAADTSAADLLVRFAEGLTRGRQPLDRVRLVQSYAASELARAGYPARLAVWGGASATVPLAEVSLTTIVDEQGVQSRMATRVRASGVADLASARDGPFTMLVAGLPFGRDTVVTIAVPPRTWLLPTDPFARLTGLAATPDRAPPYRLSLGVLLSAVPTSLSETVSWRREGDLMLGDALIGIEGERRRAQIEVDLRGLGALLPRGALLVLLDVAIVLLIWTASAMADGGFWRWFRRELSRWRRAYRSQLSVALLAFFLAPAVAFAAWEAFRLREDDRNARALLVREALRTIDLPSSRDADGLLGLFESTTLAGLAGDAGGPLFAYRDGVLRGASDPVLEELAPFGTLLPLGVPSGVQGEVLRLDTNGEVLFTQSVQLATRTALVGFRPTLGPEGAPLVLATAARGDEFALDARRSDLAILVVLVIVSGVLSALWLSGAAARTLARPIGTLRDAALAIASGRPMPPLDVLPPAEFVPVFGAFARMATDLSTSRAALEEAQRRTSAVLREVASGVVAVRHDGTVLLANPRAESLLGLSLAPGTMLLGPDAERDEARVLGEWPRVAAQVREFLERPDRALSAFDVTTLAPRTTPAPSEMLPPASVTPERQLRASLTRLPGGAVLTLDDVTELATAQRVLAWGEMARQVAHEIKNPLTPIRLGVQHLRRAWRDGRVDFATILDANVTRILSEIDHLDEIARAFSRYGSVPAERAPAELVDVALVVRDVVELERMGESELTWELEIEGVPISSASPAVPPVLALARAEELKEVLLNLLENARLAQASVVHMVLEHDGNSVYISVRDNGIGMTPDVMQFIFQPHFSTRTSGSGLGLAISRRLLEGWGGTIAVASEPDVGSTLTVTLQSA